MKFKLYLLALTAVITVVACNNETQEDKKKPEAVITKWTKYQNQELGFAGEMPSNWEVREEPGVMLVLSDKDEEEDPFREYFSINLKPIQDSQSKNLDTTVAFNLEQAKKAIDSMQITQYDKVTFENIPAYETTYKGTVNNLDLEWHTVFFIKNNIFFTILYNYQASKADIYREIGYQLYSTFTFNPDSMTSNNKPMPELAPLKSAE